MQVLASVGDYFSIISDGKELHVWFNCTSARISEMQMYCFSLFNHNILLGFFVFWKRDVLQGFLILVHSTSVKIFAGIAATLCYLKLVQHFQPYADHELNRMKETSLWQIFSIFFLALLIKTDEIDSSPLKVLLVTTFFADFIILFCVFCAQYLRKVAAEHRPRTRRGTERETEMDYRNTPSPLHKASACDEEMEMEMETTDRLSSFACATSSSNLNSNNSDKKDSTASSSVTVSPLFYNA